MEQKEQFLKNLHKGNSLLIGGIFFFIMALLLGILIYGEKKEEIKNVQPLVEVKKEGVYASIDVSLMTDYFATNDYSGVAHQTYFVWDDKYIYIVDLNDKARKDLEEIYNYSYSSNKENAPVPVRISGMTKIIPNDLKKIAMEAYNTIYIDQPITSDTFSNYLGIVYLDTFLNPMNTLLSNMAILFPILLISILLFLLYFKKRWAIKNCMLQLKEEWDKVLNELNFQDTIFYKKLKLYITKNYIVNYTKGLKIYSYKDIVWFYPHEYRYNGRINQKSIVLVTKDSKTHKMVTLGAGKKNLILFDEIYNTLLKRLPNTLSGYNKENKEKVKKLFEEQNK